jgi:hypothetical protein
MEINCDEKGKVKFGMTAHVENMIKDFPVKLKSADVAKASAGAGLFEEGQGGKLPEESAEALRATAVQGLFPCKCARPDTQPMIAAPCTQVKGPHEDLVRLMKCLISTALRS